MNTLNASDIEPGTLVVFVDHALNDHPACFVAAPLESLAEQLSGKAAMVVAVEPEKPGKAVAVCFKAKVDGGHSCDGRVPDGHGAYVLPEHLYLPEDHARHQDAHAATHAAQAEIDAMLAGFVAP